MEKQKQTKLWKLVSSEDGSLSVEFALWVPVIFMVLMFVADASAAFFAQANMWHTAGYVARALATGTMSVSEAQQFLATYTRFTMEFVTFEQTLVVEFSQPFSDIGTGVALSFVGDMRVQVFQHLERGVTL